MYPGVVDPLVLGAARLERSPDDAGQRDALGEAASTLPERVAARRAELGAAPLARRSRRGVPVARSATGRPPASSWRASRAPPTASPATLAGTPQLAADGALRRRALPARALRRLPSGRRARPRPLPLRPAPRLRSSPCARSR